MAKDLQSIMQEQLGGMMMQLCIKESVIQQLQEEVAELKKQLPAKKEEKK